MTVLAVSNRNGSRMAALLRSLSNLVIHPPGPPMVRIMLAKEAMNITCVKASATSA
ncbi:MAG: hypothetical protein IPI91_05835 [Flavobacteriales bacterium]|nr:hypothetical protein [Flavobacteriales bacterium]